MGNNNKKPQHYRPKLDPNIKVQMLSKAVIGGGCFWCTEAVFQRLKGVHKVESGYAGGHIPNPTYKQICTGSTGHAEVIRISYDPQSISYKTLLYIFFHVHDPTTLNRQGNDTGTQYRSTIMYETEEEKNTAHSLIEQVTKDGDYPSAPNKIVTEIVKLQTFYPAEEYHQDYYNLNPTQGYCMAVIAPKISKFQKMYKEYLGKEKL